VPPVADPVVDWAAIGDVVWASLLGGVLVTAAFAVGVRGAIRATDARRSGHMALAYGYWAMMVLGMGLVAAAVVFGIVVITNKS
jgi:hypothetical protein